MANSVLIFVIFVALSISSDIASGRVKLTDAEIQRKLKLLNKPAVKSIKDDNGEIIDCVELYKQSAFDLPELKNHKIQMRPSYKLEQVKLNKNYESCKSEASVAQDWHKNGKCPEGTVPIRRIQKEDLLRADSLQHFGMKPSNKTNLLNGLNLPGRSAAVLVTIGYNYIGAKGDINVWRPSVDQPDDYTTAQIWLRNGPNLESVESGWTINPKLYGDADPHLFVYWTKDGYISTGCFDLTCPGFVQTSRTLYPGVRVTPWSTKLRQQFHYTIAMYLMYLDDQSGNWWLHWSDTEEVIGYWPKELFTYLSRSAIAVHWGGEVYSKSLKTRPHTKTQMGSGDYARSLFGNANFIRNIRIKDYSKNLKYPEWVGTTADEDYCYSAYNDVKYGVEPVFYFGGPGGSDPLCGS